MKNELEENRKYASKNFAFSLLTIADNFQRAMRSIPKDISQDKNITNLVEGIKANGITVEYVVFDDEGHGFRKKENEIEAYGKVLSFLETYLKNDLETLQN